MATGAEFTIVEAGYMTTNTLVNDGVLRAGEVGYLSASIKSIGDTRVGDTVTHADRPCAEPLPGYRKVNPMVFPVSIRQTVHATATCGTHWKNCS